MAQPRASTQAVRKHLLSQMTANSAGKVKTKIIRFSNNDVPTFLKKLDAFEKASARVRLQIT